MKEMQKNLEGTAGVPAEAELTEINRFAKSPLRAEEVYAFSLRLCDNEVDRDWERVDQAALAALGDLFVGKSGIFDHQWTAEGQTARIYRTEVVRESAQVTAAGDGYCWLKAWAYLLRTEKNADLIAEIEGGAKRAGSVGCGGARSFVAVPAQRKAGVLKRYGPEDEQTARLRVQAELGRKYLRGLRREVVRLAMLSDNSVDGGVLARAAERLEEPELLELKRVYETQVERKFPPAPQLRSRRAARTEDETEFLI